MSIARYFNTIYELYYLILDKNWKVAVVNDYLGLSDVILCHPIDEHRARPIKILKNPVKMI